jgi:16S rRNA U516 pseudouridylate synthase RsuA-like enzyme
MELNPSESIVAEEGASYFRDFIAIGGKLTLTNERVCFHSNRADDKSVCVEISLRQIDKVDYFKVLDINPNGLCLLCNDGRLEHFVVDNRRMWKTRISDRIKETIN